MGRKNEAFDEWQLQSKLTLATEYVIVSVNGILSIEFEAMVRILEIWMEYLGVFG